MPTAFPTAPPALNDTVHYVDPGDGHPCRLAHVIDLAPGWVNTTVDITPGIAVLTDHKVRHDPGVVLELRVRADRDTVHRLATLGVPGIPRTWHRPDGCTRRGRPEAPSRQLALDEAPATEAAEAAAPRPRPAYMKPTRVHRGPLEALVRKRARDGHTTSAADVAEAFGVSVRTGNRKLARLAAEDGSPIALTGQTGGNFYTAVRR